MSKKKLVIFYDWFYPGFNAGGPIQSLTNLAITLSSRFSIYIITSSFDLNSAVAYQGVTADEWNDVTLPNSILPVKVFYTGEKGLNKKMFTKALGYVSPDIVYLNGIFSLQFFLVPLLFFSKKRHVKIVVCPRGMLKKNAVSGKALKKKIYITYLQISNAVSRVYWHATSTEELDDIKKHFPKKKGIGVAPNIPKAPKKEMIYANKETGKLTLIYLSLINEHKNLLLLLQILKQLNANISLHIYGPVINQNYWKECEILLNKSPDKIQYKGLVEPAQVQDLMEKYDALILLTKGENFGHAIYESLSVGRPVITSHFTPWQELFENFAGANVDIENPDDCKQKIMRFVEMEQDNFNKFCDGAYRLSNDYYNNLDAENAYQQVFL